LNDFEMKNGKHFREAIRASVSAACFNFLSEVFECRRDETGVPLTANVAESTATELSQAIESKNLDLCTAILVNLSDLQISSIVREYNRMRATNGNGNKNLDSDLSAFLSGDFRTTLRSRCVEKYYFLATHIASDKETICRSLLLPLRLSLSRHRILGSLSRRDCTLLRSSFDANKQSLGGKSFSEMLREVSLVPPESLLTSSQEIKKESYLAACLNLVSGDSSQLPLGVDREAGEDNAEVDSIGQNAYRAARESYSQEDMQVVGAKESKRSLQGTDLSLPTLPSSRITAAEVERIGGEIEQLIDESTRQIKELGVEIEQAREFLFTVTKQCAQCEKWNRIYKAYAASLRQHLDRSGVPSDSLIASPKSSPKKK
jgi:hypothetical protein